ncbi:SulP family inorganic anion transporter [Nocardioides pacificus]
MGTGPAGGILRFLPGVAQARDYERGWLRGDVLAGITVASYLVPQVMAYAEVAGLPAVAGLWAILAPLVVYALLGSSRQLSVGPESTTSLMTAAAVGALVGGAGVRYAEAAAALAVVVGALCLLGWLGRLGFLADLLSRPVLIGYMAGIAVLMIVSQLGTLTGIDVEGDSSLAKVRFVAERVNETHLPTLILAVLVLALLVIAHWAFPRAPGPLIAMLLGAAAVAVLGLESDGIAVVGDIPRGLPGPQIPDFSGLAFASLVPAAAGVMVVAYSDNVLTGRAFATKRHESIDSDQEFLALGVANVAAGLFQGFPVSSSGSRTVIGDAMGSRTQLYSLVALVTVVTTMLLFSPVLAAFPTAALGAVVVYAALRLIDLAELRRIARFRGSELVLALSTTTAVLLLGVLPGIGVAVALSLLDLLRRIAKPHDGVLGYVPGLAGMHDIDDYPESRRVPGLVVYRYDAPLFFANAENFRRRCLAAVADADTPTEWLLLNAEAIVEVDLTAVDALDDVRRTLAQQGVEFAMARVKQDLRDALQAADFVEKVGPGRIFMTLPTAVAAYEEWYAERHGFPPALKPPP